MRGGWGEWRGERENGGGSDRAGRREDGERGREREGEKEEGGGAQRQKWIEKWEEGVKTGRGGGG